MAVDVNQVIPQVNVNKSTCSVVLWSWLHMCRVCKQERNRQASSSENDGHLDAEVFETEVITDELIQTIDIV